MKLEGKFINIFITKRIVSPRTGEIFGGDTVAQFQELINEGDNTQRIKINDFFRISPENIERIKKVMNKEVLIGIDEYAKNSQIFRNYDDKSIIKILKD